MDIFKCWYLEQLTIHEPRYYHVNSLKLSFDQIKQSIFEFLQEIKLYNKIKNQIPSHVYLCIHIHLFVYVYVYKIIFQKSDNPAWHDITTDAEVWLNIKKTQTLYDK